MLPKRITYSNKENSEPIQSASQESLQQLVAVMRIYTTVLSLLASAGTQLMIVLYQSLCHAYWHIMLIVNITGLITKLTAALVGQSHQ